MNNLLFIYGTLLNNDNEYAICLKNNSRFYSVGKLKGRLYDIGEYPGAILSSDDEYIYGIIVQINSPEKIFPVIDGYEGFGENESQPNEFIRVKTNIETDDGQLICWVYLYNLAVTSLTLIETGRHNK